MLVKDIQKVLSNHVFDWGTPNDCTVASSDPMRELCEIERELTTYTAYSLCNL